MKLHSLWACAILLVAGCVRTDDLIFLAPKTDRYRFPGNEVPALQLQQRTLTSEDGVRLAAVLALQNAPGAAPTVVYLHGQGANIDSAWADVQRLWHAGFNVFVVDYRGFGMSEGEPSEQGLYRDGRAAFAAASADGSLDPQRIVIWGFSMGTGVASALALHAPGVLLVLEAPFTSMTDMVGNSSPYAIPGDWFTSLRFDTLDRIADVPLPVLVLRGGDDRRIPSWMPEAVFERARDPKRLLDVPGAGHGEILQRATSDVVMAIRVLVPGAAPTSTAVIPP
jgi:fermentation-respiration switch protein FrsA (DUF1100 family)